MKCNGIEISTSDFIGIEGSDLITHADSLLEGDRDGTFITPGFIDLQVNGFAGVDYNSPAVLTDDALEAIDGGGADAGKTLRELRGRGNGAIGDGHLARPGAQAGVDHGVGGATGSGDDDAGSRQRPVHGELDPGAKAGRVGVETDQPASL